MPPDRLSLDYPGHRVRDPLFQRRVALCPGGSCMKPMGDDLEWSRSALSLGITAYMLVSALAMPFVGRLADRFDMRWVMGTGVVVGAVGVGLMSLIASPWQLFAVYGLVFALGNAGVSNPIVSVMIVRWFPDRRGVANSGRGIWQRHRPAGDRRPAGPVVGQVRLAGVLRRTGAGQPGDPGAHSVCSGQGGAVPGGARQTAIERQPCYHGAGCRSTAGSAVDVRAAVVYWAVSTRYAGSRTFSWQPMWWRSLWTLGSAR